MFSGLNLRSAPADNSRSMLEPHAAYFPPTPFPQVDKHQVLLGMTAVICSPRMQRLMQVVKRVALTDAVVLITGESGSGKEVVARAVHSYSLRCAMPWVDVNCAALPDHLVESELFGYEKGAFSGADASKAGLFELADKGTLFLDEIGEMDPKTQVKLLRVLDGAPYYRLGGKRKVSVNARIVTATNQDLEEGMRAGRLRKDLYHRLTQIHLKVPPLRERPEDIIPLAEFFLRQHDEQLRFLPDAASALKAHSWPGNVRELRNIVMKVAILAEHCEIRASDLLLGAGHSPIDSSPASLSTSGFGAAEARCTSDLEEMERETILRVLDQTGGHHQKAAQVLGISRRTLSRKLRLYGAAPKCESPAQSKRAEAKLMVKRKEERRPAQGEVALFWNGRPGSEQRGRLIDVSEHGFRVAHDYAAVSVGQEVRFRHAFDTGNARVVWSRILDGVVHSGFQVLQRAV